MARRRAGSGFWKKALVTVPAIVGVGFAIGVAAKSGFKNPWYAPLAKPDFQPPAAAFPVAWTALYAAMGLALAAVLDEPSSAQRSRGLTLFGAQLLLNYAWSPIFFRAHAIDIALVDILLTDLLVVMTIISFWRVRPLAGALLLPYLAWLCLATALNHETGRLNPGADSHPLGITGA